MVDGITTTAIPVELTEKEKCEGRGGVWDESTQTCNLPGQPTQGTQIEQPATTPREQQQKQQQQQAIAEAERRSASELRLKQQEAELDKPIGTTILPPQKQQAPQDAQATTADTKIDFLPNGTINFTRGGETLNLTKEEYDVVQGKAGIVTDKVKQAQALQSQAQIQSQQLAGQVGQFEQQEITPTGLNVEEGLTTALVSQLPKALTFGIGAAAVTGAGTNPLSIIAGVGTFLGTLTSGIISNFSGQRRDTTTAQQRVLDEGKQTMNDWVTMAESDPANKAQYLAEFNKVAAQIDQAFRQMKLDTSEDVAKFETALPNLAEFEAFYAAGGERDVLNQDMRNSLIGISAEGSKMLDLINRVKK